MRSLLDRDDIKLQVAGHETFPCRYGWLKKSYDAVCEELAVEDEQQQHAFFPKCRDRKVRCWQEHGRFDAALVARLRSTCATGGAGGTARIAGAYSTRP